MQVEIGKRYRFVSGDGSWTVEGTVCRGSRGDLQFLPDDRSVSFAVNADGTRPSVGRLQEIPAVPRRRPLFDDDPEEFRRLRDVFVGGWDFSTGTY